MPVGDYPIKLYQPMTPGEAWERLSPHRDEELAEAPVETNEQGGQQHAIQVRFQDIDAKALAELAEVMWRGVEESGYAPDNWRLIPAQDHYNHAMAHLVSWRATGLHDDAVHALARAMMLVALT